MDIFQYKKAMQLLYGFFVRGESDVCCVPYVPAKTVAGEPVPDFFPRLSPAERGVSPDVLCALLEDLEHSSRVNIHSITVLCDGAVIAEASAPGYDRRLPHETHSMCKTITGLAIGLLFDEGKIDLDTPAYRYFSPARLPARLSGKHKAITVRHLLTMSTGVTFNESGAATETDWVRAYFSAGIKGEPGGEFAYNSMNTYILAALVQAITGEGVLAYLRPRLLDPLGIGELFWEKCPRGIEKGGWGLYIAQEDAAKIGEMCRLGGVFGGRRILSETWLSMATSAQKETPADAGDYNYAFQMWAARDGSSFLFNGMLGQNVWVCPQSRMVVVMNAGNSEFFQKSTMLTLVSDRLGRSLVRSDKPLPRDRRAMRRLRRTEAHFYESRQWIPPLRRLRGLPALFRRLRRLSLRPLPALCEKLEGRRFRFPKNNSGILPVFTRMMQNNHTEGLSAISFARRDDRFFLTMEEGSASYCLEIGFYDYVPSLLNVRGERYRAMAMAGFAVDEENRRLLKIDIVFPELSHTRRMKLFFDDEQACLRLREVPGREIVDGLLRSLPVSAPKTRGIVKFISNRLNLDYILIKTYDKFEPKLVALPGDAAVVSGQTGPAAGHDGGISEQTGATGEPDAPAMLAAAISAANGEEGDADGE